MDDCSLKKLAIKPGTLTPLFHADVLDYTATVSSEQEKILFECITNDSSASYDIRVSIFTVANDAVFENRY